MDSELYDMSFVDLLTRQQGLGGMQRATLETLLGLNSRGYGSIAPMNTDQSGLILFSKPRLNLSYDNLSSDRELTPYLTENLVTYQRMIRDTLDPIGASKVRPRCSPLVDPNQPFIPLLTNTIQSASGWPDKTAGTYTSDPGLYRQSYAMFDDHFKSYDVWDLSVQARNIKGTPLMGLINLWIKSGTAMYEGTMWPWSDAVAENKIDYVSRCWRLVLSQDLDYVQHIASTIVFPYTLPTSSIFNYDQSISKQVDSDMLSFSFKCAGFEFNDPLLIQEFNKQVAMYCAPMAGGPKRTPDANFLVKLDKQEKSFYNYYGYPYIVEDGENELQWWVRKDVYNRLRGGV